jgi:hypothetical protein
MACIENFPTNQKVGSSTLSGRATSNAYASLDLPSRVLYFTLKVGSIWEQNPSDLARQLLLRFRHRLCIHR